MNMVTLSDIGADAASSGDGESNFLSGVTRQEMYEAQYGFYVIGATPRHDGVYGGKPSIQTFFKIKFAKNNVELTTQGNEKIINVAPGWSGNSEDWILPLGHNDDREAQAKKCLEALAAGSPGVGPCFLGRTTTKAGHPYWLVQGKRDTPTAAPVPVVQPASGVTVDDNDIPF